MKNQSSKTIGVVIITVLSTILAFGVVNTKTPPKSSPAAAKTKGATATSTLTATATPTLAISATPTLAASATLTLEPTNTPTETATPLASLTPTDVLPTATPLPTVTPPPTPVPGVAINPYLGAPQCPDVGEFHDTSLFHTEWDFVRGCHYDHEHGQDPFTQLVADTFPGYNLLSANGGHQVGSPSPTSPRENAWDGKHGGWKWQVTIPTYSGCTGFEGAPTGITAAVVGYHAFGDYSDELNGRIHSAEILAKEERCGDPLPGYVFVVQHQDYGRVTVPYQGDIMPYPYNPTEFDPARGPYISMDCFGDKGPNSPPERGACRLSLQWLLNRLQAGLQAFANSIWTSKPTGAGVDAVQSSKLFRLLFRVRDTYQLLDWSDQTYPFTFGWLCSNDGGATYAAKLGCPYNNTTTSVHEVWVSVPPEWDGVPGLDTDGVINGRFSGQIWVTPLGDLAPAGVCLQPNATCMVAIYQAAFTGPAGGQLIDGKLPQFSLAGQPERAICFNAAGAWVNCDTPGAKEAPWIGSKN